jgi:hypothetical protein
VLTHVGPTDRRDFEQNDARWQHQLDRLASLLGSLSSD